MIHELVAFARRSPRTTKADLAAAIAARFQLTRRRSVYVGDHIAVRFSSRSPPLSATHVDRNLARIVEATPSIPARGHPLRTASDERAALPTATRVFDPDFTEHIDVDSATRFLHRLLDL